MKTRILKNNTLIIFILLLIVSSIISPSFLTSDNIANLLRQIAPIGMVSIGMFLVILTGGIDLSVGSIVATVGVVFALLSYEVYFAAAFLIAIVVGVAFGTFSGYLVAYRKIAPFIATLAMMTIVRGGGFLLSKGAPINVGTHSSAIMMLGSTSFIGVPLSAWILGITVVVLYVLIEYHVLGRKIIAVGSNEEAVRLAGISVEKTKFIVYVLSAFLTSIAALMIVGRTGVGTANIGVGLELDAIAAVVIGGASLSGGKGTILNTIFGVLILGLIGNIMNLMDVTSYLQQLIKGLIIILAVLFQSKQK